MKLKARYLTKVSDEMEPKKETTWIYRKVKKVQQSSVDKYNLTNGKDTQSDYVSQVPTEIIPNSIGGWSICKREDDYTTFRKKVWK